jgi:thiol-disulfide isomerase/thioredoxin
MNKKLLFGVSFLFIFVLLAGCTNIEDENGLNETESPDLSEQAEFDVKEETINDVKGILEDLIYLNSGMQGQVSYVSGEMDGEYKVLTFMINDQEVQEIYVTEDEKSILQAPPISIDEMKSELVLAKVQMEEYMDQMANQTEPETEVKTDPLEGTNMTVQECLDNEGFDGYIFLYSTNCPHCQTMLPIVDELIAEGYNIEKVTSTTPGSENLDNCLSDISGYVPEFICNTGNKEASHLGGGLTKEDIINLYNACGTQ